MRASCLFSSLIAETPGKVFFRFVRVARRSHVRTVAHIPEERQILSGAG